mmetsp:Transcript_15196/g.35693  ORF Transcript_15196/g.35693 Transcript_15196/m.35693 type:complete len:84 (+) Transcript_15196:421-672(+)
MNPRFGCCCGDGAAAEAEAEAEAIELTDRKDPKEAFKKRPLGSPLGGPSGAIFGRPLGPGRGSVRPEDTFEAAESPRRMPPAK